MCAGNSSKAKAKVGSWITLAEWEWSDEKKRYVPVCVKTEYVDGENIKDDTWYQLKNGKFVEVNEKLNTSPWQQGEGKKREYETRRMDMP